MSVTATEIVWGSSRAQRGALLVMLALAREADDQGFAVLTLERLAKLTRLSTRAITNCLAELSKLGELAHKKGVGRGNPNRYEIRLGRLAPGEESEAGVPEEGSIRPGKAGSGFLETPAESGKSATESRKNVPRNVEGSSSRAPVVNTPVGSINNLSSKPASSSHPRQNTQPRPEATVEAPAGAREVVDAMTSAGMLVGWRLTPDEWARVTALSARWGAQQLVDVVARRWDHARPPQSARYLLRIWDDLPSHGPAAQPVNVIPLRRTGGWQTYRNQTTASAYENGF
ncbi:hypothetical protein [Streptomyces cinereoruber]|uniref:hypothetical protein n=1 Tax=Streptomyces cinereoruber TaxID=67260 RepID=UPI003635347B